MNERIEELLIKAIKTVGPDDQDKGAKEKTLEKFAELIVNECASLFEDDLRTMEDFTGRACRRAIKEHFGVE
jgi:hypothetical protein